MYYFYIFCCHSNQDIFLSQNQMMVHDQFVVSYCSLEFHAALELHLRKFSIGILHLKHKYVAFLQIRITLTDYIILYYIILYYIILYYIILYYIFLFLSKNQ